MEPSPDETLIVFDKFLGFRQLRKQQHWTQTCSSENHFPKKIFKQDIIDDLSRFVLILLRMRMQEFSAGNRNINKGADQ